MNKKYIQIKLIKSIIGCSYRDKLSINALGLQNLYQVKIFEYNKYIINIIYKIYYLLEIKNL